LFNGTTLVLSDSDFSLNNIWNIFKKYSPTIFFSVPHFYRKLINDPNIPPDIPSMLKKGREAKNIYLLRRTS